MTRRNRSSQSLLPAAVASSPAALPPFRAVAGPEHLVTISQHGQLQDSTVHPFDSYQHPIGQPSYSSCAAGLRVWPQFAACARQERSAATLAGQLGLHTSHHVLFTSLWQIWRHHVKCTVATTRPRQQKGKRFRPNQLASINRWDCEPLAFQLVSI